jgi:hypothetical protein
LILPENLLDCRSKLLLRTEAETLKKFVLLIAAVRIDKTYQFNTWDMTSLSDERWLSIRFLKDGCMPARSEFGRSDDLELISL